MPISVAIFGLGFIGQRLSRLLKTQNIEVLEISRQAGLHWDLSDFSTMPRDLRASKNPDISIVTLDPTLIDIEFWSWLANWSPRRTLLGTTSSYQRTPGETITENTSLDPDHKRYFVEQRFGENGGQIVRLSGLWGGDRNPLKWIKKGRIGYNDRQVNFVHGDDVAQALASIIRTPTGKSVYNLADGQKHTWQMIIEFLIEQKWLIEKPPTKSDPKIDAFVDPRVFLEDYPEFQFKNFWDALEVETKDWLANQS